MAMTKVSICIHITLILVRAEESLKPIMLRVFSASWRRVPKSQLLVAQEVHGLGYLHYTFMLRF
jgi:hypothetical protein